MLQEPATTLGTNSDSSVWVIGTLCCGVVSAKPSPFNGEGKVHGSVHFADGTSRAQSHHHNAVKGPESPSSVAGPPASMVHHSLLSPGSYRAPNLAASITASFRARRLPTGGVAQPGLSWPCISSLSLRHAACRGLNATAPATATATNTLTPAAAAVLAAAASRLTAGNSNTNREEKPSTSAGQNKDISLASKQEQQRQQQGPQPQAHLEGRLLNLCLGPLPLLEQRFTVGCCPTSSALSTRPSATTQGGSNGDQQASGPGEKSSVFLFEISHIWVGVDMHITSMFSPGAKSLNASVPDFPYSVCSPCMNSSGAYTAWFRHTSPAVQFPP
jgi:hypothetical protein